MATFDVMLRLKKKTSGLFFVCLFCCWNSEFLCKIPDSVFFPPIHRLVENVGKGRLESESQRLKPGGIIWSTFQTTRWISKRKTSHAPKNPKAFLLICSSKSNQSPSEKISFKLEKYGMIFPQFQSEKENMFWNMYLVVLVSGFACVHHSLSKRSLPQRFCQCHPMSAGTAELCFFICHIARLEAWHGVINIWGDMMPTKRSARSIDKGSLS